MEPTTKNYRAWVVAVDMGYGHQRAAYPLRFLAPGNQISNANNYPGIPPAEYQGWRTAQRLYESISRLNNIPVIGRALFNFMDYFQSIPPFYPERDLSSPSLQTRQNYYLIRRGLGKNLIAFLNTQNIPLITTFFTAAFMAEEHNFKNEIYLQICDSDISRAWAPFNPRASRIKYLAPCNRVVERLRWYGVKASNIFLTGFPLPPENIGLDKTILKSDLAERIINLDPQEKFRVKYASTIKQFLPGFNIHEKHHHPLTITFAVGGAGAQRGIAIDLLRSLRAKILAEEIVVNLVAGSRPDVYDYFKTKIESFGLASALGRNLMIVFADTKEEYFKIFNAVLRRTDILWTKPSEMVFYSALGLPIIMAPSLGSQEVSNRTWLKTIGAGIAQNDPRYTHQWLFDWVNSGWLAEAALSGYLDARQFGVQNIIDVVFNGVTEPTLDNSLL